MGSVWKWLPEMGSGERRDAADLYIGYTPANDTFPQTVAPRCYMVIISAGTHACLGQNLG